MTRRDIHEAQTSIWGIAIRSKTENWAEYATEQAIGDVLDELPEEDWDELQAWMHRQSALSGELDI